MSLTFSSSLERAILETLAYSDVFDYPLTLDELHRYLTYPATKEEIRNCLDTLALVLSSSDFYFLSHRSVIVNTRLERESASRSTFQRALKYGRFIGSLPFVRMVTMTGSLAVLNLSKDVDMDYMLVTAPKRLWLARSFAVTLGRLMRLFGDRICVNLLVTESALEWHVHDLYSAREMRQMIPIAGMGVYLHLMESNAWIMDHLPNSTSVPQNTPQERATGTLLQKLLELPFSGRLGDALENWAMKFQVKKIMRSYGTGQEANFSAHLCQGNFHNHRSWTDQSYQERLALISKGESQL